MNADKIRTTVLRLIGDIAPEAELDGLDPDSNLQEVLGLDSMDFLTFVTALSDETGFEIPERDYPRIATLNGCVAYVEGSGAHVPVARP
jgi:acyl carrier protein